MKLIDRAKSNELNSIFGAKLMLYSLAYYGLLAEPFRSWAGGLEPNGNEDEIKRYNDATLDLAESIIMFIDEIKENGKILE